MRWQKVLIPVAILAVGVLGTKLLVDARPEPKKEQPQFPPPLVRVIPVHPGDHLLHVQAQGAVVPRTETALIPEVAGRVVEVSPNFASGGFFSRGDVLLRIDPVNYELAVTQAKSQVAQAKLAVAREEAEAEVARREWRDLGNGEASALARRDLQVEQARSALEAAEAALRRAERDLERTRLRAPYDGRVRSKVVDVGQYVAPGTPVGRVYAIDYAEVRLPIPSDEMEYLDLPMNFDGTAKGDVGPPVMLRASFAGETRTWQARVVRVEGEIDPQTRMVHVVARVDDPYGRDRRHEGRPPLAIGLFVDAEIEGRTAHGVIPVPREAVRDDGRIMVVDEDDRLRLRDVDILRAERDQVFVSSGLQAGERVCLSNLAVVVDGMKVRTTRDGVIEDSDTRDLQTEEVTS